MLCRLSEFNQVVEVFEDNKYNIEEVYPFETIVTCDNTVKPLMWYIDGQFITDYTIPIVQKYDDTINGLTLDQYADWLKWRGFI